MRREMMQIVASQLNKHPCSAVAENRPRLAGLVSLISHAPACATNKWLRWAGRQLDNIERTDVSLTVAYSTIAGAYTP